MDYCSSITCVWRYACVVIRAAIATSMVLLAASNIEAQAATTNVDAVIAAEINPIKGQDNHVWPFRQWQYARAFTFNFFDRLPGVPLYAYTEEGGWSPYVIRPGMAALEVARHANRKSSLHTNYPAYPPAQAGQAVRMGQSITHEQAQRAASLVNETKGTVEISSCPFPRHAIVFFDEKEKPVASVNVCFECGDILAWPPYPSKNESGSGLLSGMTRFMEETGQLKQYDRVFPLWRGLFLDELRMPDYGARRD